MEQLERSRAVRRFSLCALLLALWGGATACGIYAYTPRVPVDVGRQDFSASRDSLLVDAAAYFRAPLLGLPKLSPDGRTVAGIRAQDGAEAIIAVRVGDKKVSMLGGLRIDGGRKPQHFSRLGWVSRWELLASIESRLSTSGPLPPRQTRLFATGIGAKSARYVGPKYDVRNPLEVIERWQQFQDDFIHWLPNDPHRVVVEVKGRPKYFDLRNERYSEVRGAYSHPRISLQWYADHDGDVRAAAGTRDHGTDYLLFARRIVGEGFEEIARFDAFDQGGPFFAGFGQAPDQLLVFSENEHGRSALHGYVLPDGPLGEAIHSDPLYDVAAVRTSPVDGRLIGVEVDGLRPDFVALDSSFAEIQQSIDEQRPKSVNRIVGISQDESRVLYHSHGPQAPPSYWTVERTKGGELRVEWLLDTLPEVDRRRLSPMRPVHFEARDGTRIPAYLTVPRGRRPKDLPVVVLVHDGPAERVSWGWDPLVQFLASRGMAVFQANPRGSSGYGREYRQAVHGDWGGVALGDVLDGTRWLIRKGVADPERIAIYGTGYGGYAALLALAREPGLYRAGASFGAPTDLPEMLSDLSRSYAGSDGWRDRRIGRLADRSDRERMEDASPRTHAARIRAPVFLGHGSDDPRFSVDQTERMAVALREAGSDPEVAIYEGELDRLVDERARIDFHARLGRFFERHLRPELTAHSETGVASLSNRAAELESR